MPESAAPFDASWAKRKVLLSFLCGLEDISKAFIVAIPVIKMLNYSFALFSNASNLRSRSSVREVR